MARTVLVSAPAVEPITVAELARHLNLEDSSQADLLTTLIAVARERAEHETGLRLITQTRDMFLDGFPEESSMRLSDELAPVQSIVSVEYAAADGSVKTMSSSDYVLDAYNMPGYLFLASNAAWPSDVANSANAVRIRAVCGFGDTADKVPSAIKQWMLLQAAAMYRNREAFAQGSVSRSASVAELPGRFTDALLDEYRWRQPC